MTTAPEKTCTGPHPEGPREAAVNGLCVGHDQQRRRNPRRPLRPLRVTNQIRLGSIRVSEACAAQLDARGPTRTAVAKAVLEEWARRNP